MKKHGLSVLAAAFLLLFPLVGESWSQDAKPLIGIVSMQAVFEQTKVGIEATQRLEKMSEEAMTTYSELQTQLQTAQEANDEATVQRVQIELQGLTYAVQNNMQLEQQKMVELIAATVKQGIDQYRADNGLAVMMYDENVQSFDPALDVTEAVIEVINAIPYDLGEVSSIFPDETTGAMPGETTGATPAE